MFGQYIFIKQTVQIAFLPPKLIHHEGHRPGAGEFGPLINKFLLHFTLKEWSFASRHYAH